MSSPTWYLYTLWPLQVTKTTFSNSDEAHTAFDERARYIETIKVKGNRIKLQAEPFAIFLYGPAGVERWHYFSDLPKRGANYMTMMEPEKETAGVEL